MSFKAGNTENESASEVTYVYAMSCIRFSICIEMAASHQPCINEQTKCTLVLQIEIAMYDALLQSSITQVPKKLQSYHWLTIKILIHWHLLPQIKFPHRYDASEGDFKTWVATEWDETCKKYEEIKGTNCNHSGVCFVAKGVQHQHLCFVIAQTVTMPCKRHANLCQQFIDCIPSLSPATKHHSSAGGMPPSIHA